MGNSRLESEFSAACDAAQAAQAEFELARAKGEPEARVVELRADAERKVDERTG